MAQRVVPLTCVIPPNTAIAAPIHFPLVFASADVERIDVRIPPGPAGRVGFSINYGGGNFIPQGSGNWIIADDQYIQWPLDDAPNGGNWDIVCYNTDVLVHTLYFFFNVSNIAVARVPTGSGLLGL
jgi:hypothetical protein